MLCFFFFKQKTAYEMRISDWSSDVCSSDLSSPAVSDLVAGRVDMMIDSVTSQRQNILAKRVRALGVTSLDRHPQLPEVPTIAEAAGLPGFEVLTWCGVVALTGPPDRNSSVERDREAGRVVLGGRL